MANPRQKRKQHSGTYKPVRTTKQRNLNKMPSVKGIAGAAAIRAAWDKKKSVSQNYAAIGLATGGKPVSEKISTRGVDVLASAEPAETPAQPNSTQEPVASSSHSKSIPKGYARIIRDEQGNVVRIEEAGDEESPTAGDTLPALDLFDEEEEEAQAGTEDAPKTDVVRVLEERASKWKQAKVPQSENEIKWLMSLVQAHGDDIEAMHMDVKRNVWQRTTGELRRAVKCDRKKPQPGEPSTSAVPCSECYQRGFQCVDEIRDIQPPKLLRRGRKIQELERIFAIGQNERWSPSPEPTLERYAPPPPSAVPTLEMPFFSSRFYRRFHVQRPIVDPVEFVERFQRHITQGAPLGTYGELIAKLLATWAASYGVNARGEEEPHDGLAGVERRRAATNIMVQELLAIIDRHAVMRSISWDGVRVLLLLIPLTEEVQTDADRATMYQSTVLQVYSLSTMSDALQTNETGGQVDQMVRARIFWYGHVHEGLTNGLKGKKLIFDQDDVDAFKSPLSVRDYNTSLAKSPITNSYTYQFATAPIRLSAACRLVNATLTGPKADRAETVDRMAMDRVWTSLAACWEEFENLRSLGGTSAMQNEETDRFISGWQIFIFEALNVIRERLLERISRLRSSRIAPAGGESPSHRSKLTDLEHLHDIAESRCQDMLPQVMELIKRHIGTAFFEYDASLCRDGVFYAGERIAGEPDSGYDVHVCLEALGQMRWAYSKSTQRTEKLKAIWEKRQAAVATLPPAPAGTPPLLSHPGLTPRTRIGLGVPVAHPAGPAGPIFDPLDVGGPQTYYSTTYPVPGADTTPHIMGAVSYPGIEPMPMYPSDTGTAHNYHGRSPPHLSSSVTAGPPHPSMTLPALVKMDPTPAPEYPYDPASQLDPLDHLPPPHLQNSVKPGSQSPTSPLSYSFSSSYPSHQLQPSAQYGYGSSSIPQRGYIDSAMGSYYTNTGVSNSVDYFPDLLHFDAAPLEQQDMGPSLARTVTSTSGHLQTGTPPHYHGGGDIPYDSSQASTSVRPPASSVPNVHAFYPS